MNNVLLVGRLTKDPEMRVTKTGTNVLNLTLAVNRDFANSNGEFEADFINCILWKKLATNTSKFCKKGSLVAIKGRLQTRKYEKDGSTHFVAEVVAEKIQFLNYSSKEETEASVVEENTSDIESILEF